MQKIDQIPPKPVGSVASGLGFVSINGKRSYLWRAVDDEGEILEILVQSHGKKRTALKILRKLLKRHGSVPDTVVTDKLPSYGAALRELHLSNIHDTGGRHNNRAEHSHRPIRWRERHMQQFKSPRSAQRFLSVHASIYNIFNVQRHLISRNTLRQFLDEAMRVWRTETAAV